MHELAFPLLVALIVVALAFDFLNGLHDAANSIATVVATRLLTPAMAVAFAAFFNFAAYFLALQWPQLHKVADTIGKALQYVPKNRLLPCTNCGLAPMDREIALRKLQALAEGAALARQRFA